MRRASGEHIVRPRTASMWGKPSWGRAVVCASALCLLAACGSADTSASGATDLDTVHLGTPIATTAPVFDDTSPDDPTPIAVPTQTAVAVPTATTVAPSERVPTTVPTSQGATTSEPAAPAAPAVAATVGPATGGSTPTAAPTTAPIVGSQTVLAANGGEVYTLNCARCHAENGLGAGTNQYSSPLIGIGNRYSTAGMIAELTNGHPVTFGFAQRLSADEIASVVAYVKTAFP